MTCPHFQHDARCKGLRGRSALTLLGAIRFRRHYYYCPACGQGVCPLDQALGLSAADLTPAADEVVCLALVAAGVPGRGGEEWSGSWVVAPGGNSQERASDPHHATAPGAAQMRICTHVGLSV